MSTQITRKEKNDLYLGYSTEVWTTLKNSLYPGATDESILMVLSYCKAAQLDPMMKPVHLVPMSVKDAKTGQYIWRDIVMPGIGLYRIQAERTGLYAGIEAPVYGPSITEKIGDLTVTYPEWCEITIKKVIEGKTTKIDENLYRIERLLVNFTAREYWKENYASKKKDDPTPNAMWAKRLHGQLAKCTEAQALRKAFPELGSQPTAEEMEGKFIDYDEISDKKPQTQTTDSIEKLKETFGITHQTNVPDDDFSNIRSQLESANTIEELANVFNKSSQSLNPEKKRELTTVFKTCKSKIEKQSGIDKFKQDLGEVN